eukprot:Hpha_TRINITY_DN10831_c0_g1::TRINITY_DN10831_c0_g1_i1::g.23102::m.23102
MMDRVERYWETEREFYFASLPSPEPLPSFYYHPLDLLLFAPAPLLILYLLLTFCSHPGFIPFGLGEIGSEGGEKQSGPAEQVRDFAQGMGAGVSGDGMRETERK